MKKRRFTIVIEVYKDELLEQGKWYVPIEKWAVGRAIRDDISARPLSSPFNLISCEEVLE